MDDDEGARLHDLPPRLVSAVLAATPARRLPARQREQLTIPADDWRTVALDAEHHVVGIIVAQRLRELGLLDTVPEQLRLAWEADARHARLQHAVQVAGAARISRELSRRGIRHAFLKGFAYRLLHYRPAWVRLGGDVDVLIDRDDIEPVRQAVRALGFTQASCSEQYQSYRPAGREQIAYTEARHHELAQFVRDFRIRGDASWVLQEPFDERVPFAFEALAAGPTVHCCIDIHWAMHFLFADADPMSDLRSVPIPGQPYQFPVLAPEWNLLFTSFKLYVEAFDRPRFGFGLLVDLVALARSGPDWDVLADLAARFGLEAALFYTLCAAERLAGTALAPPGLLRRWSLTGPTTGGVGAQDLDLGDFTQQLVGARVPGRFLAERR